MPHIISSRVTQYQAQVIIGVTICRKFINSLIILTSSLSHWALGIGYFSPYFFVSLTLPISPVL
ncbi:hypothetical protein [Nostoc sp. DedQUE09]|uniref:hypothetical protein n=1 Tax=Nostoc sp. DedQUE09 TaxID=3075394 RepID=UPI002AD56C4F|nr:hypothetical protein [Nostoc sp. DedQUE09]